MELKEDPGLSMEERPSFSSYQFDDQSLVSGLHFHDQFELAFVDKGEGAVQIGDANVDFRPGMFAIIGPRILHMWEFARGSGFGDSMEGYVIHFPVDVVPKTLLDLVEAKQTRLLIGDAGKGIAAQTRDKERVRARMRSIVQSRGMLRLARLHVLLELLSMQPDRQVIGNQMHSDSKFALRNARLAAAKRFLHQHCHESLSRREVARHVGMEENAFSRFFHEASGQAFVDYLANIRIQKAARLLVARKGLSIVDAAKACGFRNQSAFNRQFIKRMGSTPSAYRKSADFEPLAP